MKIKTRNLIGPALDWAVAKCEGWAPIDHTILATTWMERRNARGAMDPRPVSDLRYSTDWAKGGPIIELEKIATIQYYSDENGQPCEPGWMAFINFDDAKYYGPTPLIAAMRCYVFSKLGEEVDVPDELINMEK